MRKNRSAADDLKDELVLADAYGRKPDQGLSAAGVLQQQLEPSEPSWHERVMDWVRAENEAAKPKQQQPQTWEQVRGELDRRIEERREKSTVEALREALGEQEQHETPSLNDSRLLTVLGSVDDSHSTREVVARLLHDHREGQQPAK